VTSPASTSKGVSKTIAALLLAVLAVAGAACSSSSSSPTTSSTAAAKLTGSITVSAASSLTGAFGQLATTFHRKHPGTTVAFNFGSSGALAMQIQQGAPADVFASASPGDMANVQQAGDVSGTPVTFARNRLEIVVKPGNPLGIHSLSDLPKAGVVALCVTTAPCGSTAQQALAKAHVTLPTAKVSLGQNVDATLAEVTTGDADAGVVYVTNAKTVGNQGVGIPISPGQNVTTSYPIAVVKSTTNRALARAWIAYVRGPVGQSVLRHASFLPPH
jgi:molybdate transport system substrate-binding protein